MLYPVLQAAARKAGQADLYLSISQPPLFLAVALSIARMCCTQYYRRRPARLARQTSLSISQPPLFLAVALSIARMCCTQYYRRPPARQARLTSICSLSLTATIVSGCSIEYRKDVLYPVLQAAARKAGQADLYLSLSISQPPLFLAVALSIARMCCTQYYRRPPARQTSISLSLSHSSHCFCL